MWTGLLKWSMGVGACAVFAVVFLWIIVVYLIQPSAMQQERLVTSIVNTNTALTKTNETNTETLIELKDAAIASSALVLKSVEDNSRLVRSNADILQGVVETHEQQTKLLEQTAQIMTDAAKIMEPVPQQREEANRLLKELLEETKKKN